MFADPTGVSVRARGCPSGSDCSKSPNLEVLFDEHLMPSMPHVPIAEAPTVTVQGRLGEHSDFWLTKLEASDFVMGIVQHGYRIPFLARPPPVFRFNHQSALQNGQFVSSEIDNLVEKRCICSCNEPPLVCSPLSVVQNDKGKQRLVVDLHCVNQFLPIRNSSMKILYPKCSGKEIISS